MISDFVYYDESSPSCLRWKKVLKGSNKKVGDVAGCLDISKDYYRVMINGERYYVSRVVWILHNGTLHDEDVIDHRNRISTDNRITNLRIVSQSVNNRNKSINGNNTTGVNGVCFSEGFTKNEVYYSKYTLKIYVDGKPKSHSFSIQKYGKEDALLKASNKRQQYLDELNKLGYGYTEEHGKPQ